MHFRAYLGRLVSDQLQAFSLISTQHPVASASTSKVGLDVSWRNAS
jgi:hypothetical protein